MKFKSIKLIYTILLIVSLVMMPIHVQALGTIIDEGKEFLKAGEGEAPIIDEDTLNDVSDNIYNILLVVAVIIAVGVGAFLGIQLMMQGAEGKAQIKEALLPYVVGCIVAFGAFGIWKAVVLIAQKL